MKSHENRFDETVRSIAQNIAFLNDDLLSEFQSEMAKYHDKSKVDQALALEEWATQLSVRHDLPKKNIETYLKSNPLMLNESELIDLCTNYKTKNKVSSEIGISIIIKKLSNEESNNNSMTKAIQEDITNPDLQDLLKRSFKINHELMLQSAKNQLGHLISKYAKIEWSDFLYEFEQYINGKAVLPKQMFDTDQESKKEADLARQINALLREIKALEAFTKDEKRDGD